MQQGQRQQLRQSQAMWQLQQQIQGIALLSLTSKEFKEAVQKELEENPALEAVPLPHSTGGISGTHTSTVTRSGEEASQKRQEAMENVAEDTETLQEHLLFQLEVMHLSKDEAEVGERLIRNLDKNGYHTLAPQTLLDKHRPLQTPAMLRRMMDVIQHFDPEGTCCNNMEESLLVQAKIKVQGIASRAAQGGGDCFTSYAGGHNRNDEEGGGSGGDAGIALALFILDGHIDTLYSNSSALDIRLILRRLKKVQQERLSLSFAEHSLIDDITLDEETVKEAVSFISTLNPRPAGNFASEAASFAVPDVNIRRVEHFDRRLLSPVETLNAPHFDRLNAPPSGKDEGDDSEPSVTAGGVRYSVSMADGVPRLQVCSKFKTVKGHEAALQRLKAKSFIENINYRTSLILKASLVIVERQAAFFNADGKASLEPFTQAELSAILDVATSTVSRMVTAKYIASPWGALYPMSYFFTNGQAKAKDAIQKILQEGTQEKELSDRQIAQRLHQMGINIARRTVAKYRAALDIQSSHGRRQAAKAKSKSRGEK